MENNLSALEEKIPYEFKSQKLLETVVTHRSYLNEHRNAGIEHNERLEFLGDAVLELIVTEYLYKKYPDPEGVLTSWRSALVRGTSLSKIGAMLGLNKFMKMSKGQSKSSQKSLSVIHANAVEALIGALYLDGGLKAAHAFVTKFVIGKLEDIIENGKDRDPKSSLQEMVQEEQGVTPQYEIISESGPDHDKQFVASVRLDDKEIAQGEGASKREAEQDAATNALNKLS